MMWRGGPLDSAFHHPPPNSVTASLDHRLQASRWWKISLSLFLIVLDILPITIFHILLDFWQQPHPPPLPHPIFVSFFQGWFQFFRLNLSVLARLMTCHPLASCNASYKISNSGTYIKCQYMHIYQIIRRHTNYNVFFLLQCLIFLIKNTRPIMILMHVWFPSFILIFYVKIFNL